MPESAITSRRVSRLAPSPTGALHLGNARTFIVNWALARQRDWTLCLRIEDLDGPRIKAGAEASALDDLAWLGVDHDGPLLRQSDDLEPYRAALRRLSERGVLFGCDRSRKEVERAASAPHGDEAETRYEPALRPPPGVDWTFDRADRNYRLRVPGGPVEVADAFAGTRTFDPSRECGDFVVWTRAGQPAYQLAVVVDDARQGVTDVVRGDDLLPSAARQVCVARALGLPCPTWWHLPLVRGRDGRRLAKRHGDTRLVHFREAGVTAERVVGLLAWWSGVVAERVELDARAFLARFDLDRLPRNPVRLTIEDEAWLAGR